MQPAETLVHSRVRDTLDHFAHTVWGKPQAISNVHVGGFEYIDLEGCLGAIRHLFGPGVEEKILVRDEYRTAVQELWQNEHYSRGAYVTGQPGIGNSLFLVYLLVRLLEQGCKVATHDINYKYSVVFTDTVVFYSLKDETPFMDVDPMWALSDSSAEHGGIPPPYFYVYSARVRLIQATSPEKARWHEWSKRARAECYVMDVWNEQEITNFANLLGYDDQRIIDLHRKWGGDPRTLQQYLAKPDELIEAGYCAGAEDAVRKSPDIIGAVANKSIADLPATPSMYFFCHPASYASLGIVRRQACAGVPTRTICRILGAALQRLDNPIKLQFFLTLSQSSATRQAAGFIYEAWFHCFFSTAGKFIEYRSFDTPDTVTKLFGTANLTSGSATGLRAKDDLPYYWPATVGYAGIDGALVRRDMIVAFQITIGSTHKSPETGMRKLRAALPARLRDLPWTVVFIGSEEDSVESAAREWAGKVFLRNTSSEAVPVAWSQVDPVASFSVLYPAGNLIRRQPKYNPAQSCDHQVCV